MPPLTLLAALSGAPMAAAPLNDLSEGWYLAQRGRPEQAAWVAVAALHADPDDVGAHRLYVWALTRGLREGPVVEALYREWLAEDPDAVPARIALANHLYWSWDEQGPWCEELESLLDPLPADPDARYWALRVRYEARATCPGDRDADADALIALGGESDGALGYGLRVRLAREDPVDEQMADDLADWYARCPWGLVYPGNLWWEERVGPALERAQAEALAAARGGVDSDDPYTVESALKIFQRARASEDRAAAQERLDALDPDRFDSARAGSGAIQWVPRTPRARQDPLWFDLYDAQIKAPPFRALRALRRVEPEVPADGPLRADFERWVGENQAYQDRRSAAAASYRAAWEANGAPQDANAWAYLAAQADTDLDDALAALDGLLAAPPRWDPRGGEPWEATLYDEWLAERAAERAEWLDTRGWVLRAMGRHEDAAASLREAVLVAPSPQGVHHLHLGLVYADLERPEAALFHLGRGLALGAEWEPRLTRQSRRVARDLYGARRWAPGGFDQWIALQAPPAAEPLSADEGPSEADYRVGQAFPDLAFQIDGQNLALSDYEGIRVVDLWATWCGPCVQALPHLSQVAREYTPQGVTVLAISVDRDMEDLEGFDEAPRRPAYAVGWAGRGAMGEAKIDGIPSTFVIDAEGKVIAYIKGYREDDTRLEDALDAALEREESGR